MKKKKRLLLDRRRTCNYRTTTTGMFGDRHVKKAWPPPKYTEHMAEFGVGRLHCIAGFPHAQHTSERTPGRHELSPVSLFFSKDMLLAMTRKGLS